MMGVVLWSDVNDQKAVFWCEDHGDLAYFNATSVEDTENMVLQPGDMVQFDVTVESKTRRAHNAHIVKPKMCNGLQDGLRQNVSRNDEEPDCLVGKVIPFHGAAKIHSEQCKISNG
ncbi:hypothetical protein OS190_10390 [Sulfitobacter sp. F26204]|uniref:hypothetical protein n=1 Tax=Sulfitobacter sp. F26204 TaxID=2996014 RepID=UPI00225E47FE|nr:hypothetical protein [Sulfitobacter sp. F26204]MCX7559976.1 hypothetical protein [Sulfitobacter sp. F26204]